MKSGLFYSFGLVTAASLGVLWLFLGKPWLRWLFSRDVGGY